MIRKNFIYFFFIFCFLFGSMRRKERKKKKSESTRGCKNCTRVRERKKNRHSYNTETPQQALSDPRASGVTIATPETSFSNCTIYHTLCNLTTYPKNLPQRLLLLPVNFSSMCKLLFNAREKEKLTSFAPRVYISNFLFSWLNKNLSSV